MPHLLVGAIAALFVTVLLMRRSILTEKIARRGHHISREYSVDLFQLLRVKEVMAKEPPSAPASKDTLLTAGSRNLVVTSPDELLSDATAKMLRARIGRLPVVDPTDPTKLVGWGSQATTNRTLGPLAIQMSSAKLCKPSTLLRIMHRKP